jgi:hypothetical protein
MSFVGSNILAGASGQGGAGVYEIARSLRFNSGDSAYLNRTPSSAGNRKTWTWSGWVKIVDDTEANIFNGGTSGSNDFSIRINDGELWVQSYTGSWAWRVKTTALFRDPSAWYHFLVSFDSTQSTSADRIKIYVNGVQHTNFSTSTYPSQNLDSLVNSTVPHTFAYSPAYSYSSFYLADTHFIDGQALAPTDFGETDDNGVWQAIDTASLTFGTNGFRLLFADNSAATATTLGKDTSGNSNNFTPNNLSITAGVGNDSLTDTPTNNFATLNPLHAGHSTLTNGNLDASGSSDLPTIIPGSGQWYYEIGTTGYNWDGTAANFTSAAGSYNFGQRPFSGTPNTGHKAVCTANLPTPTIADGSQYFDTKLYTGNSGTNAQTGLGFSPDFLWLKRRNDANAHALFDEIRGVTKALESSNTGAEKTNDPAIGSFDSNGFTLTGSANQTNASGQSYVGWAWDAGTSTVTNNDGSIASSVRANPSAGFSIVSFTAGGSYGMQSIGHGLNTTPSLVITKRRDGTGSWLTHTNATGAIIKLVLDDTSAAVTGASATDYYSVNSTTFSLYHGHYMDNGMTFINYCIAPVNSYSAVGSYIGNGSSDGVFVNTNFRPAFILLKASSISGEDWVILDTARAAFNVSSLLIKANTSQEEFTNSAYNTDILSNGFKVRNTNARFNQSGVTYVYYAVAEHPFKTARGR